MKRRIVRLNLTNGGKSGLNVIKFYWIMDRAREIEELRIKYGNKVFNEAVELCRTSIYTIEDCCEMVRYNGAN
ncbi:MAG: hypothetical protein PHD20_04735 [Clostridia bacterium]|nr:hypothetical protein [Clostridia bacterium]